MLRASDLTQKEVINIADGKRMGLITDLEVDLKKGKINAVIIPDAGKFMGIFGKDHEFEISWDQIKKIGEDVILVELRSGVELQNNRDNENRPVILEPEFHRKVSREDD